MKKEFRKKILSISVSALFLSAALSFSSAFAAENNAVLSGLQISPDGNGSYNIVLNADQSISFEKYVGSQDKLELKLKDVKAADSLNTIYNNTSGIDHVIVQPEAGGKMSILMEGRNVALSNVSVDAVQLPVNEIKKLNDINAEEEQGSTIVLDKPVDAYKPLVDLEEEVDTDESLLDTLVPAGLTSRLFSRESSGWLVSFGMLLVLFFSALRMLAPKKEKLNINLSQGLREREAELFKDIDRNELVSRESLIGLSSLKSNKIPASSNTSTFRNYGLREYQSNQRDLTNKVADISSLRAKPTLTSMNTASTLTKTKPALKQAPLNQRANSQNIGRKEVERAKLNIDNMKFLESMAQIYEKSGRIDLAHGLQNNILKAKAARY